MKLRRMVIKSGMGVRDFLFVVNIRSIVWITFIHNSSNCDNLEEMFDECDLLM